MECRLQFVLTADNYEVTILEKSERLGGKLNKRGGKGFSFGTGPSILTMPWVLAMNGKDEPTTEAQEKNINKGRS